MKIWTIAATCLAAAGATEAAAQADTNRAVLAEIRKVLAANYVVVDKRASLDAALADGEASGRYDTNDPVILAERVTRDLVTVARDAHLGLQYAPTHAAALPAEQDDDNSPDSFMDEQARTSNEGVTEMRVLDGNVRYVRYQGFMWSGRKGAASAAAIDRAAEFMRGGDAIIIDLRDNGGGDPRAVRRLTSYFVPPRTALVTFHLRSEPPETVFTETKLRGERITGKPVYLLTSRRTVSAAEEFASHAAYFGFGTQVGSVTAGGAHRNALYPIANSYVLSVSIGRPVLPDGGDWEGKGVSPRIAVAPELALDAAQAAILSTLSARAIGANRNRLSRIAAYYKARVDRLTVGRSAASYAGRYGERTVRVNGDTLTIQRGTGVVSTLVPLGDDRFALSADPSTQVVFGGIGIATTITIERSDGKTELSQRAD